MHNTVNAQQRKMAQQAEQHQAKTAELKAICQCLTAKCCSLESQMKQAVLGERFGAEHAMHRNGCEETGIDNEDISEKSESSKKSKKRGKKKKKKKKRRKKRKEEEDQESVESASDSDGASTNLKLLYVSCDTLKCPESECDIVFSSHASFEEHMYNELGEARPYRCHKCSKGFAKKGGLIAHIKCMHMPKAFGCHLCAKEFVKPGELDHHIKSVHDKETRFDCAECGKGFYHEWNLKAHLRVHTGEKPFACDQCEKAFAHKGNLKRHLRTHSGQKPFQCTKCRKAFTQSSSRNKHQKKCRK